MTGISTNTSHTHFSNKKQYFFGVFNIKDKRKVEEEKLKENFTILQNKAFEMGLTPIEGLGLYENLYAWI